MAQLGHAKAIMTPRIVIRAERDFFGRRAARTVPSMSTLEIARAEHTDRYDLDRLAELDSADPLEGEVIVGRIDGEVRAALSLADGRVVADPFVRTNDLVEVLRLWTS
jgi:hypothetical protein